MLNIDPQLLPIKNLRNRVPYLINCDLFHTDIIFTLIRELFTRTARDIMAYDSVSVTERLKSDVITRTEQCQGRCSNCSSDVHRDRCHSLEKDRTFQYMLLTAVSEVYLQMELLAHSSDCKLCLQVRHPLVLQK